MEKKRPFVAEFTGQERYQRLLAGEPQTNGIKSGRVILQTGEAIGSHVTDAKEEVIIILKGSAEVVCEREIILTAKENSVVYIPPQTLHDVKNTGTGILEYIFVTSPVLCSDHS